jgi:hypothetical protein
MTEPEVLYVSMSLDVLGARDEARLDTFFNTQAAYAADLGVSSPTIYAYEALGVALATDPRFFSEWGWTSDGSGGGEGAIPFTYARFPFVSTAYATLFEVYPSYEQEEHFEAQYSALLNFYAVLYPTGEPITYDEWGEVATGISDQAYMLARGGVFGQMIGFKVEADPTYAGWTYGSPYFDFHYPPTEYGG